MLFVFVMALRRAVLKTPSTSPAPPRSPIHKPRFLPTRSESTLPQLLIPLDFNSCITNVYKKPQGGIATGGPKFVNSSPRPPRFVIPSGARISAPPSCFPEENLLSLFPLGSSLFHYALTSLSLCPAAHTRTPRNSNPLYALLHTSLYTAGMPLDAPHDGPFDFRPASAYSPPPTSPGGPFGAVQKDSQIFRNLRRLRRGRRDRHRGLLPIHRAAQHRAQPRHPFARRDQHPRARLHRRRRSVDRSPRRIRQESHTAFHSWWTRHSLHSRRPNVSRAVGEILHHRPVGTARRRQILHLEQQGCSPQHHEHRAHARRHARNGQLSPPAFRPRKNIRPRPFLGQHSGPPARAQSSRAALRLHWRRTS